jgi:2-dehydropantoate 2-reductase
VTREPIAVLGIGGVGGMVAARTGAVCVGTERTVNAIRARGLTLTQGDVTTVVHPDAVTRLDRPIALLVVAVKAYDLDAALERVAPAALHGALVLPLLNGLEHVDALRRRLGASDTVSRGSPAVAAGSIGRVEAFSPEPGVVVQRTTEAAIVEAACAGLGRVALEAALASLRVPGIEVVVADDERAVLWSKTTRLAILAAATVASGRTVGELRDDPSWRARLEEALREACAVAAAEGVSVDPAGQWAIIQALPHDLTTSAARDASAGRPTELDAIAGSVVRAGLRLGVPTTELARLLAEAQERSRPAA